MKFISLMVVVLSLFLAPLMAEPVQPLLNAELISEEDSIQPGKPFWIALHLNLEPGWHIGWKNAGESGLPTTIDWDVPAGYEVAQVRFPVPKRFDEMGLAAFGYDKEVAIMAEIIPPQTESTAVAQFKAHLRYVACGTGCLPGHTDMTLKLPVNTKQPLHKAVIFDRFRDALPEIHSDIVAHLDSSAKEMVIPFFYEGEPSEVAFFPEQSGLVSEESFGLVEKENSHWEFILPVTDEMLSSPHEVSGVLVVKGDHQKAFDIHLFPTSHASVPPSNSSTALLLALAGAFLGGLLLNLMPCVLPVLSLKVLGIVNSQDKSPREKRRHGWAYFTGVLASFLGLSGLLLLLKSVGVQLGWGFQLQDPLFVATLAALFFVMALNLYGLFEIGTSLIGIGTKSSGKRAMLSSFLNGVLATVVATPCTGPFLGTALGVAATLSPFGCLSIFASMAVGMALPYLLIASFPKLAKWLPRPGAWMTTFKQAMGFLLMASVLWLLWIFGAQQAQIALYQLLFALLLLALGGWIFGQFGSIARARAVRLPAQIIALAIVAFALFVTVHASKAPENRLMADNSPWEPFSLERAEQLHAQGVPVFVDFTAKWCLICQANHMTLDNKEIQRAFADRRVVLMRADWTRQDDTITQALEHFHRNAVPLYVFYDANPKSEPVILPQMLTKPLVLEALEKSPAKREMHHAVY